MPVVCSPTIQSRRNDRLEVDVSRGSERLIARRYWAVCSEQRSQQALRRSNRTLREAKTELRSAYRLCSPSSLIVRRRWHCHFHTSASRSARLTELSTGYCWVGALEMKRTAAIHRRLRSFTWGGGLHVHVADRRPDTRFKGALGPWTPTIVK